MYLSTPVCPECGKPACEILETVNVYAKIDPVGHPQAKEYQYGGQSNVDWSSQAPELEDHKATVYCAKGHRWQTVFKEVYVE